MSIEGNDQIEQVLQDRSKRNERLTEELAANRIKSSVAFAILADLLRSANTGRLALDSDDLVRRARECLIYE